MSTKEKRSAKKTTPAQKSSRKQTEKERIKEKEKEKQDALQKKKRLHDEMWAIVIIALGVFFAVSLQSQATGQIGIFVQDVLFGAFGRTAYLLPYYLIFYGVLIFTRRASFITARSIIALVAIFLCASAINASMYDTAFEPLSFPALRAVYTLGKLDGGVLGIVPAAVLLKNTGRAGLYIITVVGMLIALMFIIDTPLATFFDDWRIRRTASRQTKEEQLAINQAIVKEQEQADKLRRAELEMERLQRKQQAEEMPSAGSAPAVSSRVPGAVSAELTTEQERSAKADAAAATAADVPADAQPFEAGRGEFSARELQILEYVTDDTLFGGPDTAAPTGFGLDGAPASPAATPGVGVDAPPSVGQGSTSRSSVAADPPAPTQPVYHFPPIELLKKARQLRGEGDAAKLQSKGAILEETLHSFGVSASVLDVVRGPTVTRFEIQPNAGVKVASIVRLADDIALNLKAKSIRIEAPIPGKAAIGIEVENEVVQPVVLREVIESEEFRSHPSNIAVAVGKSISGERIITDLKDMPHLLIAGATGSGKSVYINTLILSLLYRAKPEEVKLLLIDPKVVELGTYNGIPHLLVPVVTEPPKAAEALQWAVSEMNDRYKKFADEGVRDLEYYNEAVRTKGEPERVLPQIIIVIDELADLMMAAPSQVEESICRLAQMARAAGMHLIVATQRPSVDVITGVIKANIPSRIAFAVASQFDSRTILDMSGAEKLVGKGDMLFSPQGLGKPIRVQGCFVSNAEIRSVIQFLKKNIEEPDYEQDLIEAIDRGAAAATQPDDSVDELYTDAVDTIVRAEQASVSMLQRRFRIGYNRAARLIDAMEERGIVGPPDGPRPRNVLMSLAEWEQMQQVSESVDE